MVELSYRSYQSGGVVPCNDIILNPTSSLVLFCRLGDVITCNWVNSHRSCITLYLLIRERATFFDVGTWLSSCTSHLNGWMTVAKGPGNSFRRGISHTPTNSRSQELFSAALKLSEASPRSASPIAEINWPSARQETPAFNE